MCRCAGDDACVQVCAGVQAVTQVCAGVQAMTRVCDDACVQVCAGVQAVTQVCAMCRRARDTLGEVNQCLTQVSNQVVNTLKPDGEPHQPCRYPRLSVSLVIKNTAVRNRLHKHHTLG